MSEQRFFIDRGTIHDRATGKHVRTNQDDGEDGITACCALLNGLVGWARPDWPHNPNIPTHCKACGAALLLENLLVCDGCPCNSPNGVNFDPKPCAICKVDCCTRPGHRLLALFGECMAPVFAPPPQDETGWMIELAGSQLWWTGRGVGECGWGTAQEGIRFARKADGENVLAAFPPDLRARCTVTDHMWVQPSPPAEGSP